MAMLFPRYHGYLFSHTVSPAAKSVSDSSASCLSVAMNFIIAMATGGPPLKVGMRISLKRHPSAHGRFDPSSDGSSCLNMMANAFGHIPLHSSFTRADPMFRGYNSDVRKNQFRKTEI